MRIARFTTGDDPRFGIVTGDIDDVGLPGEDSVITVLNGDPLYLGLQFTFACLVGFVLAEVVAITGSLWIGIVWHSVYDLAAFSTGEELTTPALGALTITTAILAAYAVWLWRRLPVEVPAP